MNLLKQVLTLASRAFRFAFYRNQWRVLIHKGAIEKQNFSAFHLLRPPKDRFWADPFVVKHENKIYLFIEVAEYKNPKGYISVLELDSEFNLTRTTKVLEEPWHLSYPYVFKHAGEFWMIPESLDNKKVTLYKCNAFPYKWEKYRDLLDNQSLLDSSIFSFNGKWWLFCGRENDSSSNCNELFNIFFSDDPIDGIWSPHPLNPIKCDLSGARPAGNVFKRNGHLMRPAQNCTVRYGGSTVIYRIEELTTTTYFETKVEEIYPESYPNAKGIHHFSECEDLVVTDMLFFISKI